MVQLVISLQNSQLPPPYSSRGRSTNLKGFYAFLRENNHGLEFKTWTRFEMPIDYSSTWVLVTRTHPFCPSLKFFAVGQLSNP